MKSNLSLNELKQNQEVLNDLNNILISLQTKSSTDEIYMLVTACRKLTDISSKYNEVMTTISDNVLVDSLTLSYINDRLTSAYVYIEKLKA